MPNVKHEQLLFSEGYRVICGIDEAGRGPLSGPVVAAAVILPNVEKRWGGLPRRLGTKLNDSKCLSPQIREELAEALPEYTQIGVGISSVEEIDRFNILRASLLAMKRAVDQLPLEPQCALVDGNQAPPLSCQVKTVIDGDALVLSIAAASIIAKVTRDRMMLELAREHPQYGWETNQGYPTEKHLEALQVHGPTPHHRRSFAPVAQAWAEKLGLEPRGEIGTLL